MAIPEYPTLKFSKQSFLSVFLCLIPSTTSYCMASTTPQVKVIKLMGLSYRGLALIALSHIFQK